jgi:hypothetical protein
MRNVGAWAKYTGWVHHDQCKILIWKSDRVTMQPHSLAVLRATFFLSFSRQFNCKNIILGL